MTTLTSENTSTTLREYLRVSLDKSGRERSPDEQHAEHAELAADRNWILHPDAYRDLGSASHLARKRRDDYQRMLDDLRGDRFGADVLLLWEGSRGSRQVREWLDLLDLLRDKGISVFVHTRRRMFDPANPYDWADLVTDAIKHQLASVDTSERSKRSHRSRLAEGRPSGKCPFGYRRIYPNAGTTEGFRQVPHPDQAPLVRELFARFRRGHSLRSIAVDWEARGVRNGSGRPYQGTHLRVMLKTVAYMGFRAYDPGRRGNKHTPDLAVLPGDWQAIVPEAMFRAVQRILDEPARTTTVARPGHDKAAHLLSMIAKCDECDGPIASRGPDKGHPKQTYTCHRKGCVRVDYVELDEVVEALVLEFLARDDVYEALVAGDDNAEDALAEAEAAVERVRAELAELEAEVRAGRISPVSAGRMAPGIEARLTEAEAAARELRTPSRLCGLIEPGEGVAERWEEALLSTKRAVLRLLCTPELLGEPRVTRSPRRGNVKTPVAERVIFQRVPRPRSPLGRRA